MTPLGRLPGITVDRVDPPAPEGLPRMDVAVFVGIAASGPMHRAVAVESVAAYAAVFGGDVAIAADPARGETIRANLPASVRAFFSNGGKRCWVVRVGMTAAHAAAWVGAPALASAERAGFAINGVLARMPAEAGLSSEVRPAMLAARSLGSCADGLTLAARVLRESVTIDAPKGWKGTGFSFADRNGLGVGDTLELAARNGGWVRYAKVVRVDSGTVWACWTAAFQPLDAGGATETGQATVAGSAQALNAELEHDGEARLEITDGLAATPLVVGRWVRIQHADKTDWLIIDRLDPENTLVAFGRAWRQIRSRMPQGRYAARRCTLQIAADRGGARGFTTGLGLAREHPAAIQAALDDDAFYAPPGNRAATTRADFAIGEDESARLAAVAPRPDAATLFGGEGFTTADHVALRTGWLPLGLSGAYGEPARAIVGAAHPLARDGLATIDERLFLDPRLAGQTLTGLAAEAERLRDLEEQQLFGIHAAIDIPADLYSPASLIAAPDASQPDWTIRTDFHLPPEPRSAPPPMPRWTGHSDGCAPDPAPTGLAGPDWSLFLDADTAVLPTPVFIDPPSVVNDGNYALDWQPQLPGTTFVLEQAGRFDFADAAQVLRALDVTRYDAASRGEGAYYYRLRSERDGNTSQYALARVVVRINDAAVVASDPAALGERVRRIQVPLLRLCAATSDWFAVLSIPRGFRAGEAGDHARRLALLAPGQGSIAQLGADEGRALSFGALYHPWLATPIDGVTGAAAPDGAIAGLYAARAQARGAWIAPASDLLADIVGLDPAIPEGDLPGLDAARVNAIRRLPAGFSVLDEDTLSFDAGWRQVHVRRLMMLLRRTALRRGIAYVFEPNGPVTRRAIERSFLTMLDDLNGRGAFASDRPGGAFRLMLPEAANDRDEGRLTVEIAVCPASALRTLTLRLTQTGNRLTIAEVA